jgi:hypothetical protein
VTLFSGGAQLIGLLLSLVGLGLGIWALVDAAQRPDPQWAAAQQNKALWIGLSAGGAVLSCCFGLIGVGAWATYWFAIRPKLEIAREGGIGGTPMPPPPPPPPPMGT